jgi:hypothetical protein
MSYYKGKLEIKPQDGTRQIVILLFDSTLSKNRTCSILR